jgi:hypothetical protein
MTEAEVLQMLDAYWPPEISNANLAKFIADHEIP